MPEPRIKLARSGLPGFRLCGSFVLFGDPQAGVQAVRELGFAKDPAFASVSADSAGTAECDHKTQSVNRRPMAIAQYGNNRPFPLAFCNVGGSDFRLA